MSANKSTPLVTAVTHLLFCLNLRMINFYYIRENNFDYIK